MNRRLNHEPDTILELNEPAPGTWWFPTNPEHRCIYRVPHRLRRVNPEAYTPQLLLIGPLHRHSLKFQALDSRGDITNTKLMGYLNMEEHKKIYLARFSERLEGEKTIDEFRRIIKEDEDIIRASYSESTAWIESPKFVDMILHDSVFILEFLLRSQEYFLPEHQKSGTEKITWDPIFEQPCIRKTVDEDLILLENQLPYFILEKLFDPIVPKLHPDKTLREIVITYFRFVLNIRDDSRFKHLTDLFRCVRVETLKSKETHGSTESEKSHQERHKALRRVEIQSEPRYTIFSYIACFVRFIAQPTSSAEVRPKQTNLIRRMYNAAKLYSAGVNFKAVTDEFSIDVRFKNGCLKIPCYGFMMMRKSR